MVENPETGAGDVRIELDGEEHFLIPSAGAIIEVNRMHGSINAAITRCAQFDFDTICKVIGAGLGLNPQRRKFLPEAVFKTGTIQLAGSCITFCHVLLNGGRPIEEKEGEGDEPDPLAKAAAASASQ